MLEETVLSFRRYLKTFFLPSRTFLSIRRDRGMETFCASTLYSIGLNLFYLNCVL